MRVTKGERKRAFVYDVKHGARQVLRIMYGGRQIWPDETARIRKIYLDMSVLQGDVRNGAWLHGLDAVSHKCDEETQMLLRAGGRDYMLQRTFGKWMRAVFDTDSVDFGVNGPVRGAIREGDEVEVRVKVPERKVKYYEVETREGYDHDADPVEVVSPLPVLPYTYWWYAGQKYRKKEFPWNRVKVWGGHTGRLYIDGFAEKYEKGRGKRHMYIFMTGQPDGDAPVHLSLSWGGSTSGWGYLCYPWIDVTLKFKVTGGGVRMRDCVREAYDFLEERAPGGYARVIEYVLERGGVLHAAPDCFLAGVPCGDAPGVLHVVFQCSHLPALRRVLLSMPQYTHVRWRRDYKGGYAERTRPVADFCRHEDFGTGLTKQGL